ncbi:uncharacterized protein LOC143449734 [Clavelina lepadiformis]|uniref:uncharacterized protein LOC143449734 n=1 Tax=Clavelina lepadiformis TaxID=159417 RepID=UPI00404186AC
MFWYRYDIGGLRERIACADRFHIGWYKKSGVIGHTGIYIKIDDDVKISIDYGEAPKEMPPHPGSSSDVIKLPGTIGINVYVNQQTSIDSEVEQMLIKMKSSLEGGRELMFPFQLINDMLEVGRNMGEYHFVGNNCRDYVRRAMHKVSTYIEQEHWDIFCKKLKNIRIDDAMKITAGQTTAIAATATAGLVCPPAGLVLGLTTLAGQLSVLSGLSGSSRSSGSSSSSKSKCLSSSSAVLRSSSAVLRSSSSVLRSSSSVLRSSSVVLRSSSVVLRSSSVVLRSSSVVLRSSSSGVGPPSTASNSFPLALASLSFVLFLAGFWLLIPNELGLIMASVVVFGIFVAFVCLLAEGEERRQKTEEKPVKRWKFCS